MPLRVFLVLLIVSCDNKLSNPEKDKETSYSINERHVSLKDLNEDADLDTWNKFFAQRGSTDVWKNVLKQLENVISHPINDKEEKEKEGEEETNREGYEISVSIDLTDINLDQLSFLEINRQIVVSEVLEGIIQYLIIKGYNIERLGILDNRNITNLSSEICKLTSLRVLIINHTNLTYLPAEIDNLFNLEVLNLSDNQLQYLPHKKDFTLNLEKIGNLDSLKQLDLSGNDFEYIPNELCSLFGLEELYLQNNKLLELPEELGNLTVLERLLLADNQLFELPASLGNIGTLQELVLSNNSIKKLPGNLHQVIQRLTLSQDIHMDLDRFYQPIELARYDIESLDADIMRKLYESLKHLSMHAVEKRFQKMSLEERKLEEERISSDIQHEARIRELTKACQLKNIIIFISGIPYYLDYSLIAEILANQAQYADYNIEIYTDDIDALEKAGK